MPHFPEHPDARSHLSAEEIDQLNALRAELARNASPSSPPRVEVKRRKHAASSASSRTNPLFPPLPTYGPLTLLSRIRFRCFRAISAVLSLCFLLAIVCGAFADAAPRIVWYIGERLRFRNPEKQRPFYEEELARAREREARGKAFVKRTAGDRKKKSEEEGAALLGKRRGRAGTWTLPPEKGPKAALGAEVEGDGEFVPTEGGKDKLCVDIPYYARRVGLDAEMFEVETDDGFLIELWHIFNPRDRSNTSSLNEKTPHTPPKKLYPVLLMHGLLQSAGAYTSTSNSSLAFFLAKSGFDVWLGNNRCAFTPRHRKLRYSDPRMWAWNIRQMGVMDLPAFVDTILAKTGFTKLGLAAHSQGTTQTFVALAKEQRPDLGEKLSVFCALAPAAYAGPLIGKVYLKFMKIVPPPLFRLIFGYHAFIPLMPLAHAILPPKLYSWMGYHVFSFLFSWSDTRWDRGLRDRMFQQAPTYVSAESMRWWLGREGFAQQKCVLATREEGWKEDQEDEEDDEVIRRLYEDREPGVTARRKLQRNLTSFRAQTLPLLREDFDERGRFAWYDERFPPLALWVAGADDLVDGRRLLRRFDRGREPHVRIVHKKIIEGYEHLDVIWAMDMLEKVGKEVREVLWRTVAPQVQRECRTPVGCEDSCGGDETPPLQQQEEEEVEMHSGGKARMSGISEDEGAVLNVQKTRRRAGTTGSVSDAREGSGSGMRRRAGTLTIVDESRETPGEHDRLAVERRRYSVQSPEGSVVFEDLMEREDPFG